MEIIIIKGGFKVVVECKVVMECKVVVVVVNKKEYPSSKGIQIHKWQTPKTT
jgi:hypothetical protein